MSTPKKPRPASPPGGRGGVVAGGLGPLGAVAAAAAVLVSASRDEQTTTAAAVASSAAGWGQFGKIQFAPGSLFQESVGILRALHEVDSDSIGVASVQSKAGPAISGELSGISAGILSAMQDAVGAPDSSIEGSTFIFSSSRFGPSLELAALQSPDSRSSEKPEQESDWVADFEFVLSESLYVRADSKYTVAEVDPESDGLFVPPLIGGGGGGGGGVFGGAGGGATMAGAVIDGYVSGAKVFLDLDGDFEFDDDEPYAFTDEFGAYSFATTVNPADYKVVSLGGIDMQTLASVDTLLAPGDLPYVTPISTVFTYAEGAGDGQGATLLADLGLTAADMAYDPIAIATNGGDGADQATVVLRTGAALLTVVSNAAALYDGLAGDGDTAAASRQVFSTMVSLGGTSLNNLVNGDQSSSQNAFKNIVYGTLASATGQSDADLRAAFSGLVDASATEVEQITAVLQTVDKSTLATLERDAGAGQAVFASNARAAAEAARNALGGELKTMSAAQLDAVKAAIATAVSTVARDDLESARTQQSSLITLQKAASSGSVKVSFDEINVDAALGNEGKSTTFDITKNDTTTSGQAAKLLAVGVYDPFALSGADGSISGSEFSFTISAATINALQGIVPTGSTVDLQVAAGSRTVTILSGDGTAFEASIGGITLGSAQADGSRTATVTISGGTIPQAILDDSGELSFLVTKSVPPGYRLDIVDNKLEITIEGQDFKDNNPDAKLPSSFRLTYVVQDPGNPDTVSAGMVIAKVKPAAPIIKLDAMSAVEAGPTGAVVYDSKGYTAVDLGVTVGVSKDAAGQIVPSGLGINGSISISGLPSGSVLKLGSEYFEAVTLNGSDVWVLSGAGISANVLTGDFSGLQVLVPEHLSGDFTGISARAETRYLTIAASQTSNKTTLTITPVTDGVQTTDAFRASAPWEVTGDAQEDIQYALFEDASGLPIDDVSVTLLDKDGSEVLAAKLSIVGGPGAAYASLVKGEVEGTSVEYGDSSQQSIVVLIDPEVAGAHAKVLQVLAGVNVALAGNYSGQLEFKLAMGSLEKTLFVEADPSSSPAVFDDAGAVTFSRTVVPLADTPSLDTLELVIAEQGAGEWRQNDYADNPDNPAQSSFFMVPVRYGLSSPDDDEFLYVAISADDLSDANASISLNKALDIEDLTLGGVDWKVVPITAGEEFFLRVPYETFSPVSFRFAPVSRDADGGGVKTQPAIGAITELELPFESVPQPAAVSVLAFTGHEDEPILLSDFLSISPGQGRQLSDLVVEFTPTGAHVPSLYRGETLVAPVGGKLLADLALADLEDYSIRPVQNSVVSLTFEVEVLDPYRDGSGLTAQSSGVASGQIKLSAVADGINQAAIDAYTTPLEMNLEVAQRLNADGGIFDQIRLLDAAESYSVRIVLPSGAPSDSALVTVDGVFVMPTVVAASARTPASTITVETVDLDVYAVPAENRFGLEAGDYVFTGSRDEAGGFVAQKVVSGALEAGSQASVNPYAVEAFLGLERVAYSFTKAQIENADIQIVPRAGLAGLTNISVQVFTSQGTAIQAIPNETVLPILVRADAIAPEVQAADVIADEDQVGGIDLTVDLPINPNRVDFEKLGLKVIVASGPVDQGATFTASPYEGSGTMTFAYSSTEGGWKIFGVNGTTPVQFDPATLKYHPSANFSGSIGFSVTPFAQTGDGSIEEASPLTMGLQINAVAEAVSLGSTSALQITEDASGVLDLKSLVTIAAQDATDSDEILVFEIVAPKALGFSVNDVFVSPTSSTETTYIYTLTHPLATLSSMPSLAVVPQGNFSTDEGGVNVTLSVKTFEPTNGDQVSAGSVTQNVVIVPVPDAPDAPLVVSRNVFLREFQGGSVDSGNSTLLSSLFSLPSLSTGNSDEVVNVVVHSKLAFELFTDDGSVVVLTPSNSLYQIAASDFSDVYIRGAQYASNASTSPITVSVNTQTDLNYTSGTWDEVAPVYASDTWVNSSLFLNPVASGLTGTLSLASSTVLEDAASKLWLSQLVSSAPSAVDASETVAFYVTVPDYVIVSVKAGALYSLPVPQPTVDGARYLIPQAQLENVGLSLSRNVARDYDIKFSAVSKESNGSVSDASAPYTATVTVAVDPVADAPVVSVPSEASGLISDAQTYLKVPVRAYLSDTDGSETLSVTITVSASGDLTGSDVILGIYDAADPTVFTPLTTTVTSGDISYVATTGADIAALSRLGLRSVNDYRGEDALSVSVTATSTDTTADRNAPDTESVTETFKATIYQEIDPVQITFGSASAANFVAEVPYTLTPPASIPAGVTPDNLSLLVVLEKVGETLPQNLYFATKNLSDELVPVGATLGEGSPVWLISGRDLFFPEVDGSVDWDSAVKQLVLITGDVLDKKDVTLNVTAFVSDPDGGSSARFPASGDAATRYTVDFELNAADADPLVLSFDGSAITSVKNNSDALRIDLDGDDSADEIPTYWFAADTPNYAFLVKNTIAADQSIAISDLFVDFESLVDYVGSAALDDGVISSSELSAAGVRLWSDLDADGVYDADTELLGLSVDGTTSQGTFDITLPPQLARASEGGLIQSMLEAEVIFSGGQTGAAFAVAIPYVEAALAAGTEITGFEAAFSSAPAVVVNPVGGGANGNQVPEDVASKPGFVITLTEAQKADNPSIFQDPNHLLKVEIDTGSDAIDAAINLSAGAKDEEGGYFILTGGDANRTVKILDLPEHWVGSISVKVTPYASGLDGEQVLQTITGAYDTGIIQVFGVPDVPDVVLREVDDDGGGGVVRPTEGGDVYLTTDWQAYSQGSNNLLASLSSSGLTADTLSYSETDYEALYFNVSVTPLTDLVAGEDFSVMSGATDLGTSGYYTIAAADLADFHVALGEGVAGSFEFQIEGFSRQNGIEAYSPAVGFFLADVASVADGLVSGTLATTLTAAERSEGGDSFTLGNVALALVDSTEIFQVDILVGGTARSSSDLLAVDGWFEVPISQSTLDEFESAGALASPENDVAFWRQFSYTSTDPGSLTVPPIPTQFDPFFNGDVVVLSRANSIELVEGKSSAYQYGSAQTLTIDPDVSGSGFDRSLVIDVSTDANPGTFGTGTLLLVEEVLDGGARVESRFKVLATAFDPDETVLIRPVADQAAATYFDWTYEDASDSYLISLKDNVAGMPPTAARRLSFEYQISEGEGDGEIQTSFLPSTLSLTVNLVKDVTPAEIDVSGAASALSITDGKPSEVFVVPLASASALSNSDDEVYYLLSDVPEWLIPYAVIDGVDVAVGFVEATEEVAGVVYRTYRISPDEISSGELFFEVANRFITATETKSLNWHAVFVEPTNMKESASSMHTLAVTVAPSPQKPTIYGPASSVVEEDSGAFDLSAISFGAGSFSLDTVRASLYISDDATLAGITAQTPEQVVVLYAYDSASGAVLKGGQNRLELTLSEWESLALSPVDDVPIAGSSQVRNLYQLDADAVDVGHPAVAGTYAAYVWDKYDFSGHVTNTGSVSWTVPANYNDAISYEIVAWQELGGSGLPSDPSLIAYRRFNLDYTNVPEDVTLGGLPSAGTVAEGEIVEIKDLTLGGLATGDSVAIQLALPEAFIAYRRTVDDPTFDAILPDDLIGFQYVPSYIEGGYAYYILSTTDITTSTGLVGFVAPSGTGGSTYGVSLSAQANDPTTGALGAVSQVTSSLDVIATLDTPELSVQKALVAPADALLYSTHHSGAGINLTKPLNIAEDSSATFSYISYSPDVSELVRTTITIAGTDAQNFELTFAAGVTVEEPTPGAGVYIVTSASRLPIDVTVQTKSTVSDYSNFKGTNLLDMLAGVVASTPDLYRLTESGASLDVAFDAASSTLIDAFAVSGNVIGTVVEGFETPDDYLKVYDIDAAALGVDGELSSGRYAISGSITDGWSLVAVELSGSVIGVDDLPYISIVSESIFADDTIVPSNPGGAVSDQVHVPIVVRDANDQPIIQGDAVLTADFVEAQDVTGVLETPTYTETGTLTFVDADGDYGSPGGYVHDVSIEPITAGITADGGARGQITVSTPSQDLIASRTVEWQYEVQESAIDDLYYGETETEQYEIIIDDGQAGGINSTTITITLSGDNDLPVISTETISLSAGIGGDANTSVSVDFTDVDLSQSQGSYYQAGTRSPGVTFVSYTLGDEADGVRLRDSSPVQDFLTVTGVSKAVGSSEGSVSMEAIPLNRIVDFWIKGNSLELNYDVTVNETHDSVGRQTSATETVRFVVDEFVLPDIAMLADSAGLIEGSLLYRHALFGYDAADGFSNDFSRFAVSPGASTVLAQDYVWAISTSELIDGSTTYRLSTADVSSLGTIVTTIDRGEVYYVDAGGLGGQISTSGYYVLTDSLSSTPDASRKSAFGLQPFYINLSASANVTAADFVASHGTVVGVTPRNFSYDLSSSTSTWVVWVQPDEGTRYTQSAVSIAPDSTSGVSVSYQSIRQFIHPETTMEYTKVTAQADGQIGIQWTNLTQQNVIVVQDMDGNIIHYQGTNRGFFAIPSVLAGQEFVIGWGVHGRREGPTPMLLEPDSLTVSNASIVSSVEAVTTGESDFGLQPFYVYLNTSANVTAADFVASHGTVVDATPRNFSYDINSSTSAWVVWVRPDEGTAYTRSTISIAPDSTSGASVNQQDIRPFLHPESDVSHVVVAALQDGSITVSLPSGIDKHVLWVQDSDGRILNYQGSSRGDLTIPNVVAGEEFTISWAFHGEIAPPTASSNLFALTYDYLTFFNGSTSSISDGGRDAYDGGNNLFADGVSLLYDDAVSDGRFGAGSQDTMRYGEGVWAAFVTGNTANRFQVTGNLGSDSSTKGTSGTLKDYGGYSAITYQTYDGYGNYDPSINRIFIYKSNGDVTVDAVNVTAGSDSENWDISGLSGVSDFAYFVLYGQDGSAGIAQDGMQAFMEAAVDQLMQDTLVADRGAAFDAKLTGLLGSIDDLLVPGTTADSDFELIVTNADAEPFNGSRSDESYLIWADRSVDVNGVITYDVDSPTPILDPSRSTNILGTDGQDVIFLSDYSDGGLVYGGLGHDIIEGSGGDDMIIASAGVDVMTGGGGKDAFVVSSEISYDRLDELSDAAQNVLFEDILGQTSANFSSTTSSLGTIGFAGFVTDFDASVDAVIFAGVEPSAEAGVFQINDRSAMLYIAALDDAPYDMLGLILLSDELTNWDDVLVANVYAYT